MHNENKIIVSYYSIEKLGEESWNFEFTIEITKDHSLKMAVARSLPLMDAFVFVFIIAFESFWMWLMV